MIFTWYATSSDNDDVPYRVTLFVAMLSILGLAASVGGIGVNAAASVGFVLGIAFLDRINEGTTNDRVLLARLGAVAFLVLITALGSPLSSLAFTALVVLALAIFESLTADPPA